MKTYLKTIIEAENERRIYLGKEPKYNIEGEKIGGLMLLNFSI